MSVDCRLRLIFRFFCNLIFKANALISSGGLGGSGRVSASPPGPGLVTALNFRNSNFTAELKGWKLLKKWYRIYDTEPQNVCSAPLHRQKADSNGITFISVMSRKKYYRDTKCTLPLTWSWTWYLCQKCYYL